MNHNPYQQPKLPNLIPDPGPTDMSAAPAGRTPPDAQDHTLAHSATTASLAPAFSWRWNLRALRHGCYLIRFTPRTSWSISLYHYDGTMRVERAGTNTIASGDLYFHNTWMLRWGGWGGVSPEPNPAGGIPIFPRSRYRYYLRVTQILEWYTFGNSFTLKFERHRYTAASGTWTNEGEFTAVMKWDTAPSAYPDANQYLTGEVKDSGGSLVGDLRMGWVSPKLRKATIEVDRVSQSEPPDDNGSGLDWDDVFDAVDWDINVVNSDSNLTEPSGQSWSNAELHSAMLTRRDSANLDSEWRYHLICVRGLDATSRGIMYDAYAGDSNNIPREGAAIASHWMIPSTSTWGTVAGQRFGTAAAPYFRTAVHELGHALGLYHNSVDNGFMNTTGVIASSPGTFPANVQWSFNGADQKRLKHMPDPWVRPGMIPFGSSYGSAPISPTDEEAFDAEGLVLSVSSLLDSVPIGAPVRVEVKLENTGEHTVPVPGSLSLKSEHVSGSIVDPSSTSRSFRSIFRCLDDHEQATLEPGDALTHAMTLLRGHEGALFSSPGLHTIEVVLNWDVDGIPLTVSGSGTVMVTPPKDDAHAAAARRVLSTPDTLLSLAIGGDHLKEGNKAVKAAMKNDTLRPHFAVIAAKLAGRRFLDRAPDIARACKVLDEHTVASSAETRGLAEMINDTDKAERGSSAVSKAAKVLRRKAKDAGLDRSTRDILKKLSND